MHVCKSPWKLPQISQCPSLVNDPHMQELDHYRARANDLQKAQEEQLSEIARIPKELESLEFVGLLMSLGSALPDLSALSADHVRTVLICPKSHSDSSISVQTESFLERLVCCFLLFDAHGLFHFRRSATKAAKRLPECMIWKRNTRQRYPSLPRTPGCSLRCFNIRTERQGVALVCLLLSTFPVYTLVHLTCCMFWIVLV